MAPPSTIELQDAVNFIVHYLRSDLRERDWARYGHRQYDVYLTFSLRAFFAEHGAGEDQIDVLVSRTSPTIGSTFMTAAWELCRRGVLRPGMREVRTSPTSDGSGGLGFSVTEIGERWLRDSAEQDVVPPTPGRLPQMFAEAGPQFGPGFVERAHEAVAAYSAVAYMACCAMCGAAAESIILALAIAKKGTEKPVLDRYAGAQGRSRVEGFLLGGQSEPVRDEFRRYAMLLKYWRDSSAHGKAVRIQEPEAYQSLALLLRFALFARDHWDTLTA